MIKMNTTENEDMTVYCHHDIAQVKLVWIVVDVT